MQLERHGWDIHAVKNGRRQKRVAHPENATYRKYHYGVP